MLEAILQGVILGSVQGLTEFFPVSSSGHLILVPLLFHWADQGQAFDTVLHLGTLVALLWYFWGDIWRLLQLAVRGEGGARRFIAQVVVAALPALVVAALLQHWIEAHLRAGWIVALDTTVWALVLLAADRWSARTRSDQALPELLESVTWKQSLAVGFAQPLALLPGTSRSGITMTAALFAGASRAQAAKFSFFLSIPVTAAAGADGLWKVARHGAGPDSGVALVVGFLVAAATGAWAIRFLLSYVAKKHYDLFVYYRLALAALVLVLRV
jgi:undecaprenyl-diphosphatase